MAKQLTDKQRKGIIADRIEGMSIRKLAKKYEVSTTTIQRTIRSNPEVAQKVTEKKEQNTQDMLAFLESQSDNAQAFVAMALEALQDPSKLQKASVQTIATAMGIVIDKFLQTKPKEEDEGVIIIWD